MSTTATTSIKTDAVLHYHEGIWGKEGYAVANHGNQPGTLNERIHELVEVIGVNVFAMMHRDDIDMTVPPRKGVLLDLHNLIVRIHNLLEAHTVPHNEEQFDTIHVNPAGAVFRVWPVPYYFVRNRMMKEWCTLGLYCISEIMQHTENRLPMDIGPRLSGVVRGYMRRIYRSMAITCFGKTREEAFAEGFFLSQADFDAYNPDAFFTETERVDTVPNLGRVFTEDMLSPLRAGLLVTALPADMRPFPNTLDGYYDAFYRSQDQQLTEHGANTPASEASNKPAQRQPLTPTGSTSGSSQPQSGGRTILTPTL
jgi:hypothetical protein